LSRPLDKFRYASSEYQYIAFDELTDFAEEDYLFLFSRLRRSSGLADVPLRMRAASNPGGRGHLWVKGRFIPEEDSGFGVQGSAGEEGQRDGETERSEDGFAVVQSLRPSVAFPAGVFEKHGRLYVPSRIEDNPHLDGEGYRESLLHLPLVERERLMHGDWQVQQDGQFREEWLRYFLEVPGGAGSGDPRPTQVTPLQGVAPVNGQVELFGADGRILATIEEGNAYRFVTIDPAGTSEERTAEAKGRQPSWSVVQVWEQPRREWSKFLLLRHQERKRVDFAALCDLVRAVVREWRPEKVFVEGERLGQAVFATLSREDLPMECLRIGGEGKVERAGPLIVKMERGEIFLPLANSSWRRDFEAELLAWTGDKAQPADQIDAAAYAVRVAEARRGGVVRVIRMGE
jgi:phage terminase large subunit-like protein